MAFEVLVILAGVIVGAIKKGSIWNIANLNIKIWWILPVAYLLQHISITYFSGMEYEVMIILSYALMIGFCVVNIKVPGLIWGLAGTSANFIALAVNGLRMPAYIPAVKAMAPQILPYLEAGTYGKSIAMTNKTHLNFLGDIFGFNIHPASLLSIGDILFSIGLVILIQSAMVANRKGRTPHE